MSDKILNPFSKIFGSEKDGFGACNTGFGVVKKQEPYAIAAIEVCLRLLEATYSKYRGGHVGCCVAGVASSKDCLHGSRLGESSWISNHGLLKATWTWL